MEDFLKGSKSYLNESVQKFGKQSIEDLLRLCEVIPRILKKGKHCGIFGRFCKVTFVESSGGINKEILEKGLHFREDSQEEIFMKSMEDFPMEYLKDF